MDPDQAPAPLPASTALVLATFADLYRQEVAAEEDVHRTLPFFGTALGIVIGALAYAAGRLPNWRGLADLPARIAFSASAVLLGLAILEAGLVLVWLSRAIARRDYQRIGPEPALLERLAALRAYHRTHDRAGAVEEGEVAEDLRQVLIESYATVSPANRALNQRRLHYRALAASHLVRSLIWALAATTFIFVSDKLGALPRLAP